MSGYARKSIQILGGGWNPLPPGDKTPITDYLLAQNWRSDSSGQIIARAGYPQIFSIAGAGIAHSASSGGGIASPLYVGCNSSIAPPITSAVYFNGNAAPIATGFDGNRIGFAAQNGFMYVMNRGNQGRHSAATGWQTWNLTPPPASPIVTASAVNVTTTVAASIAIGAQTVTPLSMTGIIVGTPLTVSNADLTDSETVVVTAITGTTFSAVFTSAKTGPGILVTYDALAPVGSVAYTYSFQGTTIAASIAIGAQTVTPASMAGISAGMNLLIGTGPSSGYYETVVVTAITGTTFSAVFSIAHAGPGIGVSFTDYLHYLTISGVQYSFAQNGYEAPAQIAFIMASLASGDPNCSVTYAGTGSSIVISPIVPNTLIPVSGSDGNANANLGIGGIASLPSGTYQYYLTFQSADLTLESNPSPVSAATVMVTAQGVVVTIPAADAPTDARVGFVNIYRTGGTLGNAYRVGQVASTIAAPATTFLDTLSDLQATNNGLVLPTQNDPPPAARGIIGPFFSILFAWSTAAHKNRLFWTPVNQPQYWPGSGDPQVGNWVDVGADDEEIVWCSLHTNLVIIYKERSIWMIIGSSPSTATLECAYDGIGLSGQWGLAPAGQIDYFIGPNGLHLFDMSQVHVITNDILPLFNQSIMNAGPLTPPGSILPGSAFNWASTAPYAIALGHAMGRLYLAYAEQGTHHLNPHFGGYNTPYNLLVFDEGAEPERNAFLSAQRTGRWFYHRNAIGTTNGGFFGFFFDGVNMIGLTGLTATDAQGFSLSDFRGFLTADPGPVGIECVYQSHYEDCGLPDNDKMWLEVAIDYEMATGLAGGGALVYVYFNNGLITTPTYLGLLPVAPRGTVSFPLALGGSGLPESMDGGFLARNCSIVIDLQTTGMAAIHNVYLYYYEEARVAVVASTLPLDLGVGKVKECKELQLDINAFGGAVAVAIQSDLPGNLLTTRETPTVAIMTGRAVMKYPFATQTGLLWQVVLAGGPFRLYGARLLMRVIGVFVEGYESTAGFVWDSMQIALGDGEVSTLAELRFEMQAGGGSSVQLFTDLPGEASVSQGSYGLTAAVTGRAWVTVPLPPGIEARSVQVQVTGAAGYRIYKAQVRAGHVGRYLMGLAPDGRDEAYIMSLEFDFASERRKMYKRLEIDLRANGTVSMSVTTDQEGLAAIATVFSANLTTPLGRQTLLVPLPPGLRGRLLGISMMSATPARIYRIRVWTRAIGDAKAEWKWEDVPLEASDVLPTWTDLMSVEETSPQWTLVDIPFSVTES